MSQTAEAFLQLCKESTKHPDVFAFLLKSEAMPVREKLEVVLVDQFQRWSSNQAVPVEHYMQQVPELTDSVAVPLLVEEFGYLEQRGAAPSPEKYVQRFENLQPDAYALLCEELEVDLSEDSSSLSSLCDRDQDTVQRRIGRYEVVCSIGRGAFGEVFLGKDPSLNRSVAIKIPSCERVDSGGGLEQLLDEARMVAKLDHPNIVPVYDFGKTDDGGCFIVTKYIKGKNLRSENLKTISHTEAARITASLAQALHAAHSAGVIHRDVKPANVLLDSHRRPQLLDFGLAFENRKAAGDTPFAGTPAYMSPEQASCDSGSVDGRSDIYSLGVMFYEMLTRRRPTLHATDVQPPRQLVDSIPKELERICLRALVHNVSHRFNTAKDLADELNHWLADDTGSSKIDDKRFCEGLSETGSDLAGGKLPGGSSIAVMPFTPADDNSASFALGLAEEVTMQLTRFRDILVVGKIATAEFAGKELNLQTIRDRLNVEYVLTASVRRSSDVIRVTAQVIDTSNAVSIWASRFSGDLSVQDLFDIEDDIAQQVAATLGLPAGVIANARVARQAPSVSMEVYDCVTRYFHYRHSLELTARAAEVRREVEEMIAQEPEFASAWATLAYLYLDAVAFHFPYESTTQAMLDKGGAAARMAVDKDPQNTTALTALFRYEYHQGDLSAFERTVDRALAANPNDTDMLITAASIFAVTGDMLRAKQLADRAIALNPNPPNYYYLVDCWQSMQEGDFESALNYSNAMMDLNFWKPMYQAVCLGHLGRTEEANQRLRELLEIYPDFYQWFVAEEGIWHLHEMWVPIFKTGFINAGFEEVEQLAVREGTGL